MHFTPGLLPPRAVAAPNYIVNPQLSKVTYCNGERVQIRLEYPGLDLYNQFQLDVYTTAVINTQIVYGLGSTFRNECNTAILEFIVKDLKPGIYEISYLKFHTPKANPDSNESIFFRGSQDFQRVFFIVSDPASPQPEISIEQLYSLVVTLEFQLTEQFCDPVYISSFQPMKRFEAYAFIAGLNIGSHYRFPNHEFYPARYGFQRKSELEALNHYITNYTVAQTFKDYSSHVHEQFAQKYPVVVGYFPCLVANNTEECTNYVKETSELFLEAISVTRNATGRVFDILLINAATGESHLFSNVQPYSGNLVAGQMAGENVQNLIQYVNRIARDPFMRLLVKMYQEAMDDKNPDFQIVRLWGILEFLAEINRHTGTHQTPYFFDHSGQEVEKPNEIEKTDLIERKGSASTAKVYQLFNSAGIGRTLETWDKISTWLALRNIVAHFGSSDQWERLTSPRDKCYAKRALEEMQKTPGHNPFLNSLKSFTSLVLMRKLSSPQNELV